MYLCLLNYEMDEYELFGKETQGGDTYVDTASGI